MARDKVQENAEIERLTQVISEMEETINQQQETLMRLIRVPTPYVTVLSVINLGEDKGYIAISNIGGQYIEIQLPEDDAKKLSPGTVIRVTKDTLQYIEKSDHFEMLVGKVHVVQKVISENLLEINDTDSPRTVSNYKGPAKVGDRVLLDTSGHIVSKNLGKEEKKFVWSEETNITWEDVGGHERAKESLIEAIILPSKHPEIYAKYGKKRSKGMLMYGKPGNGKTLLAKALATEVARVYGAKSSKGFMYIKGPEILNKWVGESERMIRDIFDRARDHYKENGYPAIIFIDEADSILQTRGSRKTGDMELTIVPQFLSEMDGMGESGAFVLLATNRADTIDPAILRDGRIDRKIEVARPTLEMAVGIFKIHLKGKPIVSGMNVDEFATSSANAMFDKANVLANVTKKNGEVMPFCLSHVTSGAMIAGVVERAVSDALARDIKSGEFKGMTPENMMKAIGDTLSEQRALDHKSEMDEFTEPWRADVKSVNKVV